MVRKEITQPVPKQEGIVSDHDAMTATYEYSKLCPGFGKEHDPLKVCKRCNASILCFIVQKKKLKYQIEEARKHTPGDYFLHEYVDTIFKPGHLENLLEGFKDAIKKKGKPVPLKNIAKVMLNPDHLFYYVDYFKTHDSRVPSLILKRLGREEGFEIHYASKTISYVGE